MSKITWSTTTVKVGELKGLPENPRKITNTQKKQLQASLEKFGLVEIPVIDTDYTIVAGHQRVAVLMALGKRDEEIEVRVPSRKLTDDERKEYNLRSNKNAGEFDTHKLIVEFDKSMLHEVGFSMNELGIKSDSTESVRSEGEVIKEMELKSFEHYDYIVLVFRNTQDWLRAKAVFGLERMYTDISSKSRSVGLGRVVDGRRALKALGVDGMQEDEDGPKSGHSE